MSRATTKFSPAGPNCAIGCVRWRVNANPSNETSEEPLNPAAEEKIREFCFELALALRRITGRKVDQGLEELRK